jgi:8-oxo-dGTP pyrophosphatase MutT (NUDIX family)
VATTAVFAEILIVGLEAAAWVSLLVLDVFGRGWLDPAKLKGWETLVTLLIVALAYVLGILVDRVADTIWKQAERLLGLLKKEPDERKPTYSDMRMTILARGEAALAAFLEYQRSRLRVARGTVLNLVAIIPAGAIYLSDRTDAAARDVAWYVGLTSGALLVSVYAAARIKKAAEDRVRDAFPLVQPEKSEESAIPDTRNVAAAVCYRRSGDEIEFLLVRTKGGSRWTFPKGHIRTGEASWAAAAREAKEESGVEGEIEHTPFIRYLYPDTRGRDKGHASWVAAFLVEVRSTDAAEEPARRPRWFTAEDAAMKLAAKRETLFAAEHVQVIRAALDALAARD